MTETARAIGLVLASWALLAVAFTGAGLLVRRLLRLPPGGADSLLDAFWTGWAGAVIGLQLWHPVLPVDARAFVPLALAAVAGWLGNARDLRPAVPAMLRRGKSLAGLVSAGAFALGALLVARYAVGPLIVYDTGLYHLHAVRWAETYPIVPGLGNLHGRLAYNNSTLLYDALLDCGPLAGRGRHVANGLLLLALLAQASLSLPRAFRAADPLRPYHVFVAAMLSPLLIAVILGWASAYNPDLPAFVLGMVVVARLLRLLLEAGGPPPRAGRRRTSS